MASSPSNTPNSETGRTRTRRILSFILGVVILLPYAGLFLGKKWFDSQLKKVDNASFVLIDMQEMRLFVYDYKGQRKMECPVTTGKNYGNKQAVGDFKTPEGVFYVEEIQNASSWEYDFGDGLGPVPGSYGPWFIRLHTPGHKGIGIHGTHKPEVLGSRDSEGCIRLENKDVESLKTMVGPGTVVIILPGEGDVIADLQEASRLDSLVSLVRKTSEDVAAAKKSLRPSDRKANDPILTIETRMGKRIQ